MRQSTPVSGRIQDIELAGSRITSVARNTWLPPRLTIRNLSPARLASMATMSLAKVRSRLGGGAAVSTAICRLSSVLESGPHLGRARWCPRR